MANKKLLVVFGATGTQGGSVVRAVLGDDKMREEWNVRAITRDPSKASAKAIEKLGAEVVAADLNDANTLKEALKDAYAVFAVTNYWESMKASVEVSQGKALADAAKSAGVQHYIWSSLPNVTSLSNGVLTHVTHFDSKAAVAEYIKTLSLPYTLFMPGLFMSNLPGGAFRRLPPTNNWTYLMPVPLSTSIPLLDTASDTGKFVKGIILHREKTLRREVLGATEYLTVQEIVEQFREKFPKDGEGAEAREISHQVFKDVLGKVGLPEEGQEELLQNMRLMGEFGYFGGKGLRESQEILVDRLTTWREFMGKAKAFEGLK